METIAHCGIHHATVIVSHVSNDLTDFKFLPQTLLNHFHHLLSVFFFNIRIKRNQVKLVLIWKQ